MSESVSTSDGRAQRSQRSRESVLQALMAVIREGVEDPTLDAVAERAGVSLRTVFRHFGDQEALAMAVHERVSAEVRPILERARFEGSVAGRVAALVATRIEVFEVVAPFRRASGSGPPKYAASREGLELFERVMRQHLDEALGTELAASDDARALLEAQLSFETWNYMRTVQHSSRRRCRQLLERAVLALLPS